MIRRRSEASAYAEATARQDGGTSQCSMSKEAPIPNHQGPMAGFKARSPSFAATDISPRRMVQEGVGLGSVIHIDTEWRDACIPHLYVPLACSK